MEAARKAQVEMDGAAFKKAGYQLVDKIADFLDTIRQKPVTTKLSSLELSVKIGQSSMPEEGRDVNDIISTATDLLFNHSLFNGHPKFMGYITSSAAPIGGLADLLAASVNPNVGAQVLSPVATEIEKQVIKWLGAFIGVPACFDGVLVSGGNMANFTAFFAALAQKLPGIKNDGISIALDKPLVYCCKTTHTWIEKAAALSGIGSNAIRWIPADSANRMDIGILEQTIAADKNIGLQPIIIIGTAGDVSTGAVDDLQAIAGICKRYDCWFHVDGAYGIPAAVVPELKVVFEGINEADSIALDPHKWLYAPLEAGCTLLRDPNHLIQTYSSHPVYYNFSNGEGAIARNFYEYGFQNSRGFRALKVWMIMQQAGRRGYIEMIKKDIALSVLLFQLADQHPELEAISQHLSITTLRYRPGGAYSNTALNTLNESLLNALQKEGEVFLSNALVVDKYCLRSCIVNFRTTEKDIKETVDIIIRVGRKLTAEMERNIETGN